MSQALRTLVSFESEKFKTPPAGDEDDSLGRYGEDVCKWLIEGLTAGGVRCDTKPEHESYGWYFNFWLADAKYCLVCGIRPADEQDPGVWIAWIERSAGFVASLFGGREKGIDLSAPRQIHEVLVKSPEISNIRWHLKKDFDRGNEDAAAANPE